MNDGKIISIVLLRTVTRDPQNLKYRFDAWLAIFLSQGKCSVFTYDNSWIGSAKLIFLLFLSIRNCFRFCTSNEYFLIVGSIKHWKSQCGKMQIRICHFFYVNILLICWIVVTSSTSILSGPIKLKIITEWNWLSHEIKRQNVISKNMWNKWPNLMT